MTSQEIGNISHGGRELSGWEREEDFSSLNKPYEPFKFGLCKYIMIQK